MAYYDKIANHWHKITGYRGGAFKKYILNERILNKITSIEDTSILELGAGNGYFMPLVYQHFSGQKPQRVFITDISGKMLELAQKYFHISEAQYKQLDVRCRFPFDNENFDIVLATMVFNELSASGLKRALRECNRVLRYNGRCIITVMNHSFVKGLVKREKLKESRGKLTMPGTGGIRVPVVIRPEKEYERLLAENEFKVDIEDVYASQKVLNEKPGLVKAGRVPIATIYNCKKHT